MVTNLRFESRTDGPLKAFLLGMALWTSALVALALSGATV